MNKLCFIDTETTGLIQDYHVIYELALIVREHDDEGNASPPMERITWWFDMTEAESRRAEPTALRMGRFYERRDSIQRGSKELRIVPSGERGYFLTDIALKTANSHLVGAVPDFDARRLESFMRQNGVTPAWHYHLVDVEALAAGKLGKQPPWDSKELYKELGVEVEEDKLHGAMYDAELAMRVYDRVFYG